MTRQEMTNTNVTLDGLPARVMGAQNDFATVRSAARHEEWAWVTVERVIQRGGVFKS